MTKKSKKNPNSGKEQSISKLEATLEIDNKITGIKQNLDSLISEFDRTYGAIYRVRKLLRDIQLSNQDCYSAFYADETKKKDNKK